MWITAVLALLGALTYCFRVINQYERGVLFRLGKLVKVWEPGLRIIIPVIDKMVRVDMRTITMDVPSQDVISRDNITVKVNAVIYFRVIDPRAAIIEVENYLLATSQLAQTTLRSVTGEVELDELLTQREAINQKLERILTEQTRPWGVQVSHVEIKAIDLPTEMQRAMARQAEAERERRAKIIAAEGELQASEKLSQAAKVMASEPMSLQLRYLQTLLEMSSETNTQTIIPIPIDIFKAETLKTWITPNKDA
jgi:regulator of protease activity HflC (stomatin/prohibitin superfamily)